MGRAKGTPFERQMCKALSKWWSKGRTDDVFWRTAGSGARAKSRSKKKKKTFGQYGDIQATDPRGQPLIDVCSIELKRGYSTRSFADLIDKSDKATKQVYEKFISQAMADNRNASSFFWMLIVKRDARKPIVLIPLTFLKELDNIGSSIKTSIPTFFLRCRFKNKTIHKIFGTTLDNFFKYVSPKHIKKILSG